MGYETTFEGILSITPPLNEDEISYLNDFCDTRRMDRGRGPLYIGTGYAGQDREEDIFNYNSPPPGQPGLWCMYSFSEDGTNLMTPEDMCKFYSSAEWLVYLITHLLYGKDAEKFVNEHFVEDARLMSFTFDHMLNGEIYCQGEEADDKWMMKVENNRLKLYTTKVTWVEASSQLEYELNS